MSWLGFSLDSFTCTDKKLRKTLISAENFSVEVKQDAKKVMTAS
jgi:hypothetical protein